MILFSEQDAKVDSFNSHCLFKKRRQEQESKLAGVGMEKKMGSFLSSPVFS